MLLYSAGAVVQCLTYCILLVMYMLPLIGQRTANQRRSSWRKNVVAESDKWLGAWEIIG
jgi:hypothetical protein